MGNLHRRDTGPLGQAQYGDPSAKIWGLYLSLAEKFDKGHGDSWAGNTDGVLVFVRVHLPSFKSTLYSTRGRLVFSPRLWLLLS